MISGAQLWGGPLRASFYSLRVDCGDISDAKGLVAIERLGDGIK
jgi:hypothetical protein